ncbi:MAG: hypothetical protein V3T28_10035 [Gemmatimonadales bacterium]
MTKELPIEPKTAEKLLDIAIGARQLEIELFWRRSLFFWGFIVTAFFGFVNARESHPWLALALACFGLVCSAVWAMANRGSKYWFENWGKKASEYSNAAHGVNVFEPVPRDLDPRRWLAARTWSVSRLAIGLSDFVLVFWLGVAILAAASVSARSGIGSRGAWVAWTLVAASIGYIGVLAWCAMKTRP